MIAPGHVVRLPPVLFAIFLALGSVAQNLVPLPLGIPSFAMGMTIGVAMLVIALAIACQGIYEFRKQRTPVEPGQQPTALVTSGVFAFSRNPLYVSLALVLTSIAVMANALCLFFAAILFCVTIDRVVIAWEEKTLERTFPDDYGHYKRRVRRWI